MKRHRIPFALLGVALALVLAGCGGKGSTAAGSANAQSLLTFLPETTTGVMAFDVHRAMATDAAEKALQDPKTAPKMKEFTDKTGIDPRKDVYLVVMGLTKNVTGASGMPGAVIVNLRYDKDRLLAALKKEAADKPIREEVYKGVTIYSGGEGDGKEGTGAFLDASNIVVGELGSVKAVIDRAKGEGKDATAGAALKPALAAADKKAMFWGAFAIPAEATKKAAEAQPMAKMLEGLTSVVMAFDYQNKSLAAEIKALGGTAEQNKKIAEMITGLKAFGSAAAAKEPAAGQVVDSIAVTSGADFVKIRADIPEELLQKLGQAARDRAAGMMKPKIEEPPAAPEEKK